MKKARLDRFKPRRLQYDQSTGPSTSRLSGTLSPSVSISGLQFMSKYVFVTSKSASSTSAAGSTSAATSEYSNSTSDEKNPSVIRNVNPIIPPARVDFDLFLNLNKNRNVRKHK